MDARWLEGDEEFRGTDAKEVEDAALIVAATLEKESELQRTQTATTIP